MHNSPDAGVIRPGGRDQRPRAGGVGGEVAVELLVVEIIAGSGPDATRDRLAIVSFLGDLGTFAALWWGWGKDGSNTKIY